MPPAPPGRRAIGGSTLTGQSPAAPPAAAAKTSPAPTSPAPARGLTAIALSGAAALTAGTPMPRADAAAHAHDDTINSIRALMLIRAYRVRGHLEAKLDPLNLQTPRHHPELDPATYGFEPEDYDKPIFIDNLLGLETATIREILTVLQETYCGSIGIEFMHIQDTAQKAWLQRRIEGAPWRREIDAASKKQLLQELTEAEAFEVFCQKRFVGTKRFGLEGGESTIPAVQAMIRTGARAGVNEVVIGMAHRGRLNTLVNIVKKPFTAVFSEFGGASSKPDDVQGSGDVKYHLGTSTDLEIDGHKVHLSLQPNPVASRSRGPRGGRQGARAAG